LKRLLTFAAFTSLATCCCAGPNSYSAGPTYGTVIDATTKGPLAGVVIVALWNVEGGMERGPYATLKAGEAVTDESGQYGIGAWGPLPRPDSGVLDQYDPVILVFKSGYLPRRILNDRPGPPGRRLNLAVHDSHWNGKAIELQRYDGELKSYSRRVGILVGSLAIVLEDKNCGWKQVPKAVRALDDEFKREAAAGIKATFGTHGEVLMSRMTCAPFDDFRKAYELK
jgi:hypothetical protein